MHQRSGKFLRIFASALLAGAAHAQIPDVVIPDTEAPPITIPDIHTTTGNIAPGAERALRRLAGARVLRIEQMSTDHRAELERDPAGELAVRAEVVAVDISAPALQRALENKFLLKRTQELADLGVKISVLQTPGGWTARRGLKRAAQARSRRHLRLQPRVSRRRIRGGSRAGGSRIHRRAHAAPARVGLIDGGVDGGHQVFQNVRLQRFGCGGSVVPNAHGTAVAAILATHVSVDEIFTADVYCGAPAGGAIDAVAAALGWLAREKVGVINISLVGPRNALLERVVSTLVARGFLIVAAVGNDGPSAPPLYPGVLSGRGRASRPWTATIACWPRPAAASRWISRRAART